jgi:hypothetical protein
MLNLKKFLAMAIIITFLATIPLAFAENKPELSKAVFDLRVDSANAGPAGTGGRGANQGFILTGMKWKVLPVNIIVDQGITILTPDTVLASITAGAQEWDAHTGKTIFGSATLGPASVVDEDQEGEQPDRVNEIVSGTFTEPDIIAECTYWFTSRKEIVDFDIVFSTDFTWGDAETDPLVMDLLSIATHELGHGFGLDDLYADKWNTQTMYGYGSSGETFARTLASGDIAGIQAIYGR